MALEQKGEGRKISTLIDIAMEFVDPYGDVRREPRVLNVRHLHWIPDSAVALSTASAALRQRLPWCQCCQHVHLQMEAGGRSQPDAQVRSFICRVHVQQWAQWILADCAITMAMAMAVGIRPTSRWGLIRG